MVHIGADEGANCAVELGEARYDAVDEVVTLRNVLLQNTPRTEGQFVDQVCELRLPHILTIRPLFFGAKGSSLSFCCLIKRVSQVTDNLTNVLLFCYWFSSIL